MAQQFSIVGIGEALFDIFGSEEKLGGAPLNVAVHAHRLAQDRGQGLVVSRVGDDELGRQVLRELKQRGLNNTYMQVDPDRATGRVYVTLDDGDPSYEIVEDVAWDTLQWDPDLEDLARRADAVCFGSLAQRDAQSRSTIIRFVESSRHAVRLFDANLRQDYYDARILRRSCEVASVVKLNRDELPLVCDMLNVKDAPALVTAFELDVLAVTRGSEGTRLYSRKGHVDGAPAAYNPRPDADAVGAGDACAAAIAVGLVMRKPMQAVADLANLMGAHVAGQPGATPDLPGMILDAV